MEESVAPYLVLELMSTPEFYKLNDGVYSESDDWTLGQASVYSRSVLIFHSPQEEVKSFVDDMMELEEGLLALAAKTPHWPTLIQAGPTLIPVTFPEDPNDIMYMTREQLETELLAHRRKKSSLGQQSRRPPQSRKPPKNTAALGKPGSPSMSPVQASSQPFPYTMPQAGVQTLQAPEGILRAGSLSQSVLTPTIQTIAKPTEPTDAAAVSPADAPAADDASDGGNGTGVTSNVTGVKRSAPTEAPDPH
eukprot:TRINITY_DN19076_c0_g1_i4.p1 TRINITY_DN19076_c0_g1~~TRINITY_DN19076_c0_g1_i4.p1  ORF type:complete len:249 (+),score=45.35 TRINITY_DN19076_c0_g1_i4:211-957(+)